MKPKLESHKDDEFDKLSDIVIHNHKEIHGRIYWRLLALEQRVEALESKLINRK